MCLSKLLASLLTTLAVTLTLAAPAQAILLARDLDGNGVTDAFYDTTLNITWLGKANNGLMNWSAANTWANTLTFGGYSDWRLPTIVDTGTPGCNVSYAGGTDCGFNVQTTSGSTVYSEMASLWYDSLGNKSYCPPGDVFCATGPQAGWGLGNTGGFENLQASDYWLGMEYALDTDLAWLFVTLDGFQTTYYKDGELYAMAVRPGDAAAATVPEPESLLVALTALACMGLVRRRRRLRTSGL